MPSDLARRSVRHCVFSPTPCVSNAASKRRSVLKRPPCKCCFRWCCSSSPASSWCWSVPPRELIGLARFACWPWGAVEAATAKRILDTFAEQLRIAGPLDAVFLNLHGAMAAEDDPDLTGALLERVRTAVGADVPIVGSFDLHANITRRMLKNADVLSGYHTSPHLDSWQTGERAARALWKLLKKGVRPQTVWRKLPMLTAAEYHNTFTGPPAPIYERLKQLEAEADVLAANVAMVMPWFDTPNLGWSVVLTTNRREPRW